MGEIEGNGCLIWSAEAIRAYLKYDFVKFVAKYETDGFLKDDTSFGNLGVNTSKILNGL